MSSPARLLDVHVDADHHRSVFTLVGEEEQLVETLLAGVGRARELIDLREHEGAHPRIGAADVVPIVPIRAEEMGRARETARCWRGGSATSSELPVFLYGELAPGAGPPSSGAAARRSCSGGSTRGSWRRTSGRAGSIRAPAA